MGRLVERGDIVAIEGDQAARSVAPLAFDAQAIGAVVGGYARGHSKLVHLTGTWPSSSSLRVHQTFVHQPPCARARVRATTRVRAVKRNKIPNNLRYTSGVWEDRKR
jgi:hypothetical protein